MELSSHERGVQLRSEYIEWWAGITISHELYTNKWHHRLSSSSLRNVPGPQLFVLRVFIIVINIVIIIKDVEGQRYACTQ